LILSRASALPAIHPEDGDPIEHGRIYVAPPDQHLLVHHNQVRLSRGPRENRTRPAADPLFRSAAIAYRPRIVGVVLTGTLDDGSAGLLAVKQLGGTAVVQDPADALFSGMPDSALRNVMVDHQLPLSDIGPLLMRLANEPIEEGVDVVMSDQETGDIQAESRVFEMDPEVLTIDQRPGTLSQFGCPECGGVLRELHDSSMIRFRCRTGHAYSSESLLAAQAESFEGALWSALRALEEKVSLTRRLVRRAADSGHPLMQQRFTEQLEDAETHADTLRSLLLRGPRAGGEVLMLEQDQRAGD